jgi:hypothetical protein
MPTFSNSNRAWEESHLRSVRNRLEQEQRQENEEDNILTTLKHLATLVLILLLTFGEVISIVILYVIVRPFSLATYRRMVCSNCAEFFDAVALLLPNMDIYMTSDSDHLSPVGVSVLVCNHSMEGDWWVMIMFARLLGLRGSIKPFLQKIPPSNEHHHNSISTDTNHKPPGSVFSASSPSSAAQMNRPYGGHLKNVPIQVSDEQVVASWEPSISTIFLNKFLDFPLLSSANNQNYIQDRNELFSLLRSFASDTSVLAPTHFLLFPEGMLSEGQDRKSMIAKSVEFAKREGRPQLKHLLLPRTTGFSASLDSLRGASPVIYDCCIAFKGYDGQTFVHQNMSLHSLFRMIQNKIPNEVHIHIKRYSMEEVMGNSSWLDQKWAEKDMLLNHFVRQGFFPVDRRGGYSYYAPMHTKWFHAENSIASLCKLILITFISPLILLFTIPILFGVGWFWLLRQLVFALFPEFFDDAGNMTTSDSEKRTKGSNIISRDSNSGTPFFPATPFASPSNLQAWALSSSANDSGKKIS